MTSDFRVSIGFTRHPKTKRLKRLTGSDGVLALLELWSFAAVNRTSGDLKGFSEEDVADAADWQYSASEFVCALRTVGFIDGEAPNFRLHDWADHQPWLTGARERSESARKAAQARHHPAGSMRTACAPQDSAQDTHSGPHAALGDPQCDPHAPSENAQCPVSLPSPLPIPKEKDTVADAPDAVRQTRKRKAPVTDMPGDFAISDRVRRWAEERGFDSLDAHLESFKRYVARSGKRYSSWDDALISAIADDWAKIRSSPAPAGQRPAIAEPRPKSLSEITV